MAKLLMHNNDAREALARGVQRLANAVEPTLGPKGMNAMIDRPIGTPLISRDGVAIALEIELFDRFENMGALVVREVAMQTNDVAGDGTTTSIVLANGLIQAGVPLIKAGAKAVDLCNGISVAIDHVIKELRGSAIAVNGDDRLLSAVANIAASDPKLGDLVTQAFNNVGEEGVITTEHGIAVESYLEVVEGMSFDRGYISDHMVTDTDKMRAVLKDPYLLLTDIKVISPQQLVAAKRIADEDNRPLVIISEETSGEVLQTLLGEEGRGKYLVVHPPEYGNWRKSMMDDLAILTGGQVVSRDLGGQLENVTRAQLGSAERVEATASDTLIIGGAGDPNEIVARREQVQRQYDVAPPNIEQDKLQQRLAKLCRGSAVILAGGVTPVEQKRTLQLLEDSINAVRAALAEGVLCGGGVALARIAPSLATMATDLEGDVCQGVLLVKSVLMKPLGCIASNAGADVNSVVEEVQDMDDSMGFNAATGKYEDLVAAGIVDPLLVTSSALLNAASVATLILTTETLIGDLAEDEDPTAGPALGGGAEKLGRE